jgi:phage-related minor tail protein
MTAVVSPIRVSIGSPHRQQQQLQQRRHDQMMQESLHQDEEQQRLYSRPASSDPALLLQLLQKMQEMENGL